MISVQLVTLPAVHLERRAEIHAALGDAARLAIVDALALSDRSPSELSRAIGTPPTLLAFHLDTLERAGIVRRLTSSGDRRRRYVQLVPGSLDTILDTIEVRGAVPAAPMLFVCTHNSARSQLAAALWRREHGGPASSAGTHPADRVHPGAVAAAHRVGLDLGDAHPTRLDALPADHQIVTVCDRAHEDLGEAGHGADHAAAAAWHWSIPDPVEAGTDDAFDRALDLIRSRITALTPPEAP